MNMAARKLAKASMPPPQPLQEDVVTSMSFGPEGSSSDGGSEVAEVQLRGRQNEHQARVARGSALTDAPQQQQSLQRASEVQPRLRRTAYIPNKPPPPPPPPPPQSSAMTQQQQLQTASEQPGTIVHQTVYTRAKAPETLNRRINFFAPTPRPLSQQQQQQQQQQQSNGTFSRNSSLGSRQSLNTAVGSGRQTLKGRLTNLFRRKSRKPLPQQQDQHQWAANQTFWEQQQQQQQQRQRRHSGSSMPNSQPPPQPLLQHQLASRKSLHTFTYTDAKIYNPSHDVQHVVATPSPSSRQLKQPAPAPPDSGTGPSSSSTVEHPDRNSVWWDMRTMGAIRSAYHTDVMLVRNPEPVPDYETETTRF